MKPPPNIKVTHVGTATTLDAMLEAGELDALHSPLVPAFDAQEVKECQTPVPNFEAVERDYYQRTGIFPIQHIIVIRKDVYRNNPWIAQSLYKAFIDARDGASPSPSGSPWFVPGTGARGGGATVPHEHRHMCVRTTCEDLWYLTC